MFLFAVHGTWVSGAKIDPCVPVELAEGDTLRFGASTRVYRLHWVLQRDALEMGNPLEALIEEKEDAHQARFWLHALIPLLFLLRNFGSRF